MFTVESIHHSKYELADYLEYKALSCSEGACSIESLRSSLSASEDEIDINGTEEGDDLVLAKLQEALTYCSVRKTAITGYPCVVSANSLSVKESIERNAYFYYFLLLSTRLDMQKEKVQGGKDATEVFERLSRCIAFEYLGPHSQCEVFGTSIRGSFKNKVNTILQELHIPGEYREPYGGTGHHRDGGIDFVAWIPFADKKDSQVIAIGQCKTGNTWEVYLKKVDFFAIYSTEQPYVEPVHMFFLTEDFENHKWEERSKSAGIVFDRRRILEYLPADISRFDDTLEEDIAGWVDAAMEYIREADRVISS